MDMDHQERNGRRFGSEKYLDPTDADLLAGRRASKLQAELVLRPRAMALSVVSIAKAPKSTHLMVRGSAFVSADPRNNVWGANRI